MLSQLDVLLLESKIRYENRKAAIQLGLFGLIRDEIISNLIQFDLTVEPVVDEACEQLKRAFSLRQV